MVMKTRRRKETDKDFLLLWACVRDDGDGFKAQIEMLARASMIETL